MRRLIWGGAAGLALALAVWGVGQGLALATQRALAGRAETVVASGFPLRLGVSLTGVTLDDPASGLGWQGLKLTASAPVWSPLAWRIKTDLPQWITLAGQRFEMTAGQATARVRFGLAPDLPLRGAALHLATPALRFEAASAPSLAAQRVDLDMTFRDTPDSYQITAQIDRLALPPRLAQRLAPATPLPDVIESLSLSGSVGFMHPLAAFAARPPELLWLHLEDASLLWDGHRIAVSGGPLGRDETGHLIGAVTLALSDWPVWLDLALAAGLVPPERKPMLSTVAAYLARQSGDDTVRLPLRFDKGWTILAGVPLGPAPQF